MKNETKDTVTYRIWLRYLDSLVTNSCGFDMYSLPDWDSRASYDSGDTVFEAANQFFEWIDFPAIT